MTTGLGRTLRMARAARGLSLAGMARRTGFSRSYLGNVETGVRPVTPAVIRAYERALGEDMDRRGLLAGAASTVVAAAIPDLAVDVQLHCVLRGEDGTVCGHLHRAVVGHWFVNVYVAPLAST